MIFNKESCNNGKYYLWKETTNLRGNYTVRWQQNLTKTKDKTI